MTANVKRVDFDDEENPSHVTVRLDVRTAALVAKALGDLTHANGQNAGTTELYLSLSGTVFNTYWDGGVDGALAELSQSPNQPT
jgi:hypothetical protein